MVTLGGWQIVGLLVAQAIVMFLFGLGVGYIFLGGRRAPKTRAMIAPAFRPSRMVATAEGPVLAENAIAAGRSLERQEMEAAYERVRNRGADEFQSNDPNLSRAKALERADKALAETGAFRIDGGIPSV